MVTVVLVESENAGNIGAIARAMKNFGLSRLVLINPRVDHLCDEAIHRSKYAKSVLKKADVREYSYLREGDLSKKCNPLIATTSVMGTDYNIPRLALTPRQLAEKNLAKAAIIFGRDGSGLTNEEIMLCDFAVSIPSSREYPALNISHAAAVLFYELSLKKGDNILSHISPASRREIDVIRQKFDNLLDSLSFSTPEKRQTQKMLWQRLLGKAQPTKREAFGVLGFLKKVSDKMEKYK